MSKFSVYYDPDGMEEICKRSPFNLKKDLKNISDEEIKRIARNVADELYLGAERPPVTSVMYWGLGRKAAYGKIRTVDVEHSDGKSNGYRCITLVDMVNHCAFLLHVYKHGKDDIISQKDKNQLKKLVNEYVESLGI